MNKIKVTCAAVGCLSVLGLAGGVAYQSGAFNWKETAALTDANASLDEEDNVRLTVNNENLSIKKLNSYSDNYGNVYMTYSYAFTPSNTTRTDVTGDIQFVRDYYNSIEYYLALDVHNYNQTFTITKKADFSVQARITLTSVANPEVQGTILVDCAQKFYGFRNTEADVYYSSRALDVSTWTTSEQTENEKQLVTDLNNALGAIDITMTGLVDPITTNQYTIPLNFSNFENLTHRLDGYVVSNTGTNGADFVAANIPVNYGSAIFAIQPTYRRVSINELRNALATDTATLTEAEIEELESYDYIGIKILEIRHYTMLGKEAESRQNIVFYLPISEVTLGVKPTAIIIDGSSIVF